jgi:hypothetical protein
MHDVPLQAFPQIHRMYKALRHLPRRPTPFSSRLTPPGPSMPALLIQNATSRTLGFVLHGNDDAVVAELDAVRPGAAWTYSFEGDLVLKTLEVSVHPATGACARAATCLNAAVHKLSSSAALSDPPRTPRSLASSSARSWAHAAPSGQARTP